MLKIDTDRVTDIAAKAGVSEQTTIESIGTVEDWEAWPRPHWIDTADNQVIADWIKGYYPNGDD